MCEEGFSHSSNNLAARSAIVVRRAGLLENLLSSTRLAKISSSLKDNRISIARKSCCLISAPFTHISTVCSRRCGPGKRCVRTGRRQDQQPCVFPRSSCPEIVYVTATLETEVKAGAIKEIALITVAIEIPQALNEYRLEARHVVVEFNWPKCQVMVYVHIESSANFHGKGGCGIHETLR
jgi:hypothetical protein